ncbi:RlpA-like double-psi beta-barrel-protein domain-containing protein-containing protein [Pilobolus umbonatus]|nr:RlpA-like double-psi beta-barrel-protein domain-containing protein-containing protein [Pilobolus umbonatus]
MTEAFTIRGRGQAGILQARSENTTANGLKKRARATWYDGSELDDAACYGTNGLPDYTPTDYDMVAAMPMKKREHCYKCMKVTNKENKKSVIVKVVDVCGSGCPMNNSIDLTLSAFEKLAHRDVGVLDVTYTEVKCPSNITPKMGPNLK